MLLEKVKAKLQNDCNLLPQEKIIAGISGGVDSMVLLDILVKCGFRPVVAHFNHQLRPAAGKDAEFVQQAAERYKLDFVLASADILAQAEQRGESLEEAARNGRYRFLFRTAEENKAAAVVVAHQADDQVETILMNLLRGSGLNGLAGMQAWSISAYHPEIPLVRPLLDCWRMEINDYCREERLDYVVDETNQDAAYRRNRIRLELIPQLQGYNPDIKNSLLRLSKLAAADMELLDSLLQDALAQCKIGRAHV
jgi:tRNA(Ile)-lysidine synthase